MRTNNDAAQRDTIAGTPSKRHGGPPAPPGEVSSTPSPTAHLVIPRRQFCIASRCCRARSDSYRLADGSEWTESELVTLAQIEAAADRIAALERVFDAELVLQP